MLDWVKFHLGKRPWYWIRLDINNPWLSDARGYVDFSTSYEDGRYVVQYRYYCRMRDFIRHVQQFGWPKLYR